MTSYLKEKGESCLRIGDLYKYNNNSKSIIDCTKLKISVKELLDNFKNNKRYNFTIDKVEINKLGLSIGINYIYSESKDDGSGHFSLRNIPMKSFDDVLSSNMFKRFDLKDFYDEIKTISEFYNSISDDTKLVLEGK